MRRKLFSFVALLAAMSWLGQACSDDSGGGPTCGDGVCDVGETAEDCPDDCGCGNGIINAGEDCDGENLGGATCTDLGFADGTLGCTADCTFDTSRCEQENLCGNGSIDAGEDCDGDNLNGKTCQDLGFDDGTLDCTADCTFDTSGCCQSTCDTEGASRCSGNVVETCTAMDNGCLVWQATQDCEADGNLCQEGDNGAECVPPCQDECPADGDTQCNGDVVQVCAQGQDGCLVWQDQEDCSQNGQVCSEDANGAACVTPSGETCDEAIPVQDSIHLTGDDFHADFQNDYDFNDATDCGTANGEEIVFVVELNAGDQVWLSETGGMDAVWRVVDTCDATAATCLLSSDFDEDGLLFTADTAGTYYIILEDYWETYNGTWESDGASYDITIEIVQPESICNDGVDNDHDGDTDCADDDCTGQAPCEATEATCDDQFDNDGDGLTDCADDDCAGANICEAQEATCNDQFDNDGDGLTDCADDDCVGVGQCEATEATCNDQFDNDADGLTDCQDPNCFGQTGCETESICGDGEDNDADGATDCADDDCAGQAPCEATEATCDDQFDNDGDGLVDCEDPDCASNATCAPHTLWQELTETNPSNDFFGYTLAFAPDTNAPSGYSWTAQKFGRDYFIAPGTISATTLLSLGDDDATEIPLGFTFTFFGQAYDTVFVGSNGVLTFGQEDTSADTLLSSLMDMPKIAAFDRDLNPTDGGTITVETDGSTFLVTFDQVPLYADRSVRISFQVALADTGEIIFYYKNPIMPYSRQRGFVGIVPGNPPTTDIAGTDFIPPQNIRINEVFYNNDGSDTAEYVELFGYPDQSLDGVTLVHWNGSNGNVIWSADLSAYTLNQDGYLVIGSQNVPEADVNWADLGIQESGALQNGPDSMALVANWDGTTGDILDAVEWDTGATVSHAETAPAPGVPFASWNTSIGREPNGADLDDNSTDFVVQAWGTPGAPNFPGVEADYRITGSTQSDQAGNFPIAIPDNDSNGVSVSFDTGSFGWFNITTVDDLQVGVRILHPYRGDLRITLTTPHGTTLVLKDTAWDSNDDVIGIYDLTLEPVDSMDTLDGTDAVGTWTITVSDESSWNTGTIEEIVLWFNGH